MSKTTVIAIAVLAAVAGIVIGRYALRAEAPPTATASQPSPQDSAAESASRAMTFTQPKAPAK
jgi:hypothetical protein